MGVSSFCCASATTGFIMIPVRKVQRFLNEAQMRTLFLLSTRLPSNIVTAYSTYLTVVVRVPPYSILLQKKAISRNLPRNEFLHKNHF